MNRGGHVLDAAAKDRGFQSSDALFKDMTETTTPGEPKGGVQKVRF
jgi:hypothetical protein